MTELLTLLDFKLQNNVNFEPNKHHTAAVKNAIVSPQLLADTYSGSGFTDTMRNFFRKAWGGIKQGGKKFMEYLFKRGEKPKDDAIMDGVQDVIEQTTTEQEPGTLSDTIIHSGADAIRGQIKDRVIPAGAKILEGLIDNIPESSPLHKFAQDSGQSIIEGLSGMFGNGVMGRGVMGRGVFLRAGNGPIDFYDGDGIASLIPKIISGVVGVAKKIDASDWGQKNNLRMKMNSEALAMPAGKARKEFKRKFKEENGLGVDADMEIRDIINNRRIKPNKFKHATEDLTHSMNNRFKDISKPMIFDAINNKRKLIGMPNPNIPSLAGSPMGPPLSKDDPIGYYRKNFDSFRELRGNGISDILNTPEEEVDIESW